MRALRRDRDNNALNRSRTDPVTPVVAAPSAGGGLILKNQYVSEVLNRARENSETEKWDDDFAFDETTISPRELQLVVINSHSSPKATGAG
jgi:hypothetical protein